MAEDTFRPPYTAKLCSLTAASVTGASSAFALPIADSYTFYLNITSAGQTTTDTIFQTSVDKGTTYVYVPWKFAHITTLTGVQVLNVHCGVGPSGEAVSLPTLTGGNADPADTTATNLQAIVDPRYMKFYATIAGTSPVADLYVICWPKGVKSSID